MQLGRVLKLEDLLKIQRAIFDAGYGDDEFVITMNVRTEEMLKKVNEEFYYNGNKEGNPPEAEEVDVEVGRIKFRYVVEENVE